MQLPRGTFREIRKIVTIESLLKELGGEKFSGVASISSPSLTGTLVFKAGKCILIKFRNFRGDSGWDELQKDGSEEVDAALSLLGDAQIELALEFNKPFRILKSVKHTPSPASSRPMPSASRESPRVIPAQPVTPLKPTVKPAPSHHYAPAPAAAPHAPAHAPPPHPFSKTAVPVPPEPPAPVLPREDTTRTEADSPAGDDNEISSFETDLDTFDSMDFDNVTDKIRTDCKTMIKQLHLDHLMER